MHHCAEQFLARGLPLHLLTTEEGAATSLFCATEPLLANQSRFYYEKCAVAVPSTVARDIALGVSLCEESERWTNS